MREQGERLLQALDAAMEELRRDEQETLATRRADALQALAEGYLRVGAGDSSGADRYTVHVPARVEELAEAGDVSAEASPRFALRTDGICSRSMRERCRRDGPAKQWIWRWLSTDCSREKTDRPLAAHSRSRTTGWPPRRATVLRFVQLCEASDQRCQIPRWVCDSAKKSSNDWSGLARRVTDPRTA
jgi:hypothetical protein